MTVSAQTNATELLHELLATRRQPRFVAGSIGPTTRLASDASKGDPSQRRVTFDDLVEAYRTQVLGLIDGGADILFPETAIDTLNMKACLFAVERAFDERG